MRSRLARRRSVLSAACSLGRMFIVASFRHTGSSSGVGRGRAATAAASTLPGGTIPVLQVAMVPT